MFTLVPTSTECSADTPSSQAAFLVPGVVPPHVQHLPHFPLWNCMRLLPANCSSLSGTHWMAPGPSGVSATPPSLVPPANLLQVQTVPSATPLMSVLKRTGPSIDPWVTMIVSDLQLHLVPLISTLFNPPHCVLNQPLFLHFLWEPYETHFQRPFWNIDRQYPLLSLHLWWFLCIGKKIFASSD